MNTSPKHQPLNAATIQNKGLKAGDLQISWAKSHWEREGVVSEDADEEPVWEADISFLPHILLTDNSNT